jgi:hypothetical protein
MTQITLQTKLQNFISWIRPDPNKADDVRKQRDDVRSRIKTKAQEDGLVVRSVSRRDDSRTSLQLMIETWS